MVPFAPDTTTVSPSLPTPAVNGMPASTRQTGWPLAASSLVT
jgi:hypothetical protein